MKRQITINPLTRLQGHGKISIFLDEGGNVERAYFQATELRGFEKFCEGRAVEEMPAITQKICGVCPTAHHTASSKALDRLFNVEPPIAAKKIRELLYNAFMFEDHLLHFYFLGGCDFIAGIDAPREKKNIFGVIEKLGIETGRKAIEIRKKVRDLSSRISGSPLYPLFGVAGGVSKPLKENDRNYMKQIISDALEFAVFTLKIFEDVFLKNKAYLEMITDDNYKLKTYYMGLVDQDNKLNFYDGVIRIIDPYGREFYKFEAGDYLNHLAELIVSWNYSKILYLKNKGWNGFVDGIESGIYRVGPLARLNVSDAMPTPLAQIEYEKMLNFLGGKPLHNAFAYHWARLIEVLYSAERMSELINDPEITSQYIRNIPSDIPSEGVGVCEAPRGILFHHYNSDGRGIIKNVNLLVATQNNYAAICMAVQKAASKYIKNGIISDGILNKIETAFRTYDPCIACATHMNLNEMPFSLCIFDKDNILIKEFME